MQPRNCGFHARYILRMKEHYQSDDIHRAIEHAIRYQAFEGRAIERIHQQRIFPSSAILRKACDAVHFF